jgi:hypothetical protein
VIVAVNIVREINTGEASCRIKDGKIDEDEKYLPWDKLLDAACFTRVQGQVSRAGGPRLSSGPEIVPGFELRLIISSDGKHYNLWLGQNPVAHCAFAIYSDERGVIYEGREIGCGDREVNGKP